MSQTLTPQIYQHMSDPPGDTHVDPSQDKHSILTEPPVCYPNCPFQDTINGFPTLQCSIKSQPSTYQHGSTPTVATHVDPPQQQLGISAEPPVCYSNCPSQDNINMFPTQQCSHNSRTYHHGSAPTVATQDQQCITAEPPVCYPNCPSQDNINMFPTQQCSHNSRTYHHGPRQQWLLRTNNV